jgi:hypothetical protein
MISKEATRYREVVHGDRRLRIIVLEVLLVVCTGVLLAFVLRGFASDSRILGGRAGEPTARSEPKVLPTSIEIGSIVALPSVDFRRSRQNIVLVVSPDCSLCTNLEDFYERLRSVADRRHVPLIVVFPETTRENERTQNIVKEGNFAGGLVVRTDLRKLGIDGTPTVLVVDADGRITGLWVGRLLPEHERAMVARLENPSGDILMGIDPEGGTIGGVSVVDQLRCCDVGGALLDIRAREAFRAGHRAAATNIPLPELSVRAVIQLARDREVIIDCSNVLASECTVAWQLLHREGFRKIRLLNPWTRSVRCRTGAGGT